MSKNSNDNHSSGKYPNYKSELSEPYEDIQRLGWQKKLEEIIYGTINEEKGQAIVWKIISNKMSESPEKEFFEKLVKKILKEKLTEPNGKEIIKNIAIDTLNAFPQILEELLRNIERKRKTTIKEELSNKKNWLFVILLLVNKVPFEKILSYFPFFH